METVIGGIVCDCFRKKTTYLYYYSYEFTLLTSFFEVIFLKEDFKILIDNLL